MTSEHFCHLNHIDVGQNTPSKIENTVIRRNVRIFLNVLDSEVKKCQKNDQCVKMSENAQRFTHFRSII